MLCNINIQSDVAITPHKSNKLKLGEKTPCLQLKKITIM